MMNLHVSLFYKKMLLKRIYIIKISDVRSDMDSKFKFINHMKWHKCGKTGLPLSSFALPSLAADVLEEIYRKR